MKEYQNNKNTMQYKVKKNVNIEGVDRRVDDVIEVKGEVAALIERGEIEEVEVK